MVDASVTERAVEALLSNESLSAELLCDAVLDRARAARQGAAIMRMVLVQGA